MEAVILACKPCGGSKTHPGDTVKRQNCQAVTTLGVPSIPIGEERGPTAHPSNPSRLSGSQWKERGLGRSHVIYWLRKGSLPPTTTRKRPVCLVPCNEHSREGLKGTHGRCPKVLLLGRKQRSSFKFMARRVNCELQLTATALVYA